jgi:hypothetical protein
MSAPRSAPDRELYSTVRDGVAARAMDLRRDDCAATQVWRPGRKVYRLALDLDARAGAGRARGVGTDGHTRPVASRIDTAPCDNVSHSCDAFVVRSLLLGRAHWPLGLSCSAVNGLVLTTTIIVSLVAALETKARQQPKGELP